MSTTFTCPEAPSTSRRAPCTSPELGLTCTADERCGYCDEGWEEQYMTEAPECNFSEDNARALLALLGIQWDAHGQIPAHEVPVVLRRILRVTNVDGDRGYAVTWA